MTDADREPVITSVLTMIGEAQHDDEAGEVSSAIAARRDALIAKSLGKSATPDGPAAGSS